MEAAGLIVGVAGLAGLFSSCLEAANTVQAYLTSGTDSHVVNSRFEAVRVRFERWGPCVGLTRGGLLEDHHSALDDGAVAAAVENLLTIIKTIRRE
jgi:hypothetical protein